MGNCKSLIITLSVTWGNADDGKLGHDPKVETDEDKKKHAQDYRKRGY